MLDPNELRTPRQTQADGRDAPAINEACEAIRGIMLENRKATITGIRKKLGWGKDRVERIVLKAVKQGFAIEDVEGEEVSFRCEIVAPNAPF